GAEAARDLLIKAHNGYKKSLGNANISEPAEKGSPWNRIKGFPKIHKATKNSRRVVVSLLDDSPKSEDVIDSLESRPEARLPPSSAM
ncbi:hypothetical protein KI387_002472, partial [Taxus chinensis]